MLIPAGLAWCNVSRCRSDSGGNTAVQSPRHGPDVDDMRSDRYDLAAGLYHDGLQTLHADRKLPAIDEQDNGLSDFTFT